MAIPIRSRDVIVEAMNRFDQELRDTTYWQKWMDDTTYKYAIEYEDKLYPVKQIVSLATGAAVDDFHGGDEANNYVEERGFSVVEIHPEKRNWIFQSKRVITPA
jgi:5-methylcytosine-specific restriction protein A